MIKLSIKFDLSLGKILLGFAGVSVAVCAYKFYSSNNNEAVTCYDGEDIIPSKLQQSCRTEDKKVKLIETSKKPDKTNNKLLTNPKKIMNEKMKPLVKRPESKIISPVSCKNLNEGSESKEILEADNSSTSVEKENITQDKNKDFTQVENKSSTQVENKSSTPLKNENTTLVEKKNTSPVENINTYININFDENYLTETFMDIFSNQQNCIVIKYHMNELKKVLTHIENTEPSNANMESLIFKRLEQLQCKSSRLFMLESYQVELKVWEICSEETWNRKDINELKF